MIEEITYCDKCRKIVRHVQNETKEVVNEQHYFRQIPVIEEISVTGEKGIILCEDCNYKFMEISRALLDNTKVIMTSFITDKLFGKNKEDWKKVIVPEDLFYENT